jgi:hypothetical protein
MGATVEVDRINGAAPGSPNDITGSRTYFTTSDNHYDTDPLYPVPVPPSVDNYSFWAHLRLNCTVAPDTALDNVEFYLDAWAGGAGIDWLGATANIGADEGYRVATGTISETGTELTQANHSGLVSAPVDPFLWTSGSPLVVPGSIGASTGYFGAFVVLQAVVTPTADGAAQADTGFTFLWDET